MDRKDFFLLQSIPIDANVARRANSKHGGPITTGSARVASSVTYYLKVHDRVGTISRPAIKIRLIQIEPTPCTPVAV